ncbi:MAG: nitroreductase family protein [Candidatus Eisenbacteria bacterium]|nr:nitroreductase family protein [Candidatus Eisenbacteria bacterium]
MIEPAPNPRRAEAEVDPQFTDRWSPRSFRPDPIPEEAVRSLFEAARWAPSSMNEQPWLFLYAVSDEERARFLEPLVEGNRIWAKRAPLLLYVLVRRAFEKNGKPNRTAPFDAGSAWMSLALQARKMGLYAHGMAGFDRQKAHEALGAPEEEYEVIAAVAVGRKGDPAALPENLAKRESPSGRKPLAEVARRGGLDGQGIGG